MAPIIKPPAPKDYEQVAQEQIDYNHGHQGADHPQQGGAEHVDSGEDTNDVTLHERDDDAINADGGPTWRFSRRACIICLIAFTCIGLGAIVAVLIGQSSIIASLSHNAGIYPSNNSSTPTPNSPPNSNDSSDAPPRDSGTSCRPATTTPSSVTHALPIENSPVSRIAFGSCFMPSTQTSDILWRHVRETFRPDLWVWLGDNMYLDSFLDMDAKRRSYNEARNDAFYRQFGPPAEPKIPVTGTWDDHDFGFDNMGRDYPCLASSQNEFVIHFNLPQSDPRHPAQGRKQRNGVYNSQMFAKPGTSKEGAENGIHLINLDARTHRSPTYTRLNVQSPEAQSYHFQCDGAKSTMLGQTQWSWLENEMLNKTALVKLISSGVQVLPPTNRDRPMSDYCSFDGPGGSFETANLDVGEGTDDWVGTSYEGWAEMPQERTRLLRLAQRSINSGRARHVVFLTGDQHWAEIQAKRMPPDDSYGGEPQILFSVTASGIDQNWVEDVGNTNRLRVRSADRQGNGVYTDECNFPFVINGDIYNDCADVFGSGRLACSTATTDDNHLGHRWGNCLPAEEELVPRERMIFGLENKCTDNYHHTCSAQANYGGIVVDWERETMNLTVFTPHEKDKVASSVEIDL